MVILLLGVGFSANYSCFEYKEGFINNWLEQNSITASGSGGIYGGNEAYITISDKNMEIEYDIEIGSNEINISYNDVVVKDCFVESGKDYLLGYYLGDKYVNLIISIAKDDSFIAYYLDNNYLKYNPDKILITKYEENNIFKNYSKKLDNGNEKAVLINSSDFRGNLIKKDKSGYFVDSSSKVMLINNSYFVFNSYANFSGSGDILLIEFEQNRFLYSYSKELLIINDYMFKSNIGCNELFCC